MNKLFLLPLLLVSGCALFKPNIPDAVLPPKERVVNIDPRIFELCEPLLNISENSTFEDVLAITLSNFEIYAACSVKQSRAVKLLREFSNKKEE